MSCICCASRKTRFACGVCNVVPYCGENCASLDWARHARLEHCVKGAAPLNCIIPGLWIGGVEALSHLEANGIDAVVSVLSLNGPANEVLMARAIGDRDHLRLNHHDTPDDAIEEDFDRAAQWVGARHHDRGRTVLIHCYAGMSRSVTIAIAYMIRYGYCEDTANGLSIVQKARPVAHPNKGFVAKLQRWANGLY